MKAIRTTYRGRKFRSRLESEVACLLDGLGVRWEYEPMSFLLESGTHYLPDFWVPEIRAWVEARGYTSAKGERQIEGFAALIVGEADTDEGVPDYLVVHADGCKMHDGSEGFRGWSQAVVRSCQSCNQWSFIGEAGSYRCRRCGAWDGDHNLIDLHDIAIQDGHVVLVDELGIAVQLPEFLAEIKKAERAA